MVGREGLLGVEGGDNRDVEGFGQFDQFVAGAGGAHAAAGHDDRSGSLREFGQGRADAGRIGFRTERGCAAEGFFDDDVEVVFGIHDVAAGDAPEIEVGGARRTRDDFAQRLAQEDGELLERGHRGAELGDRLEGGRVVDLLIGVAVLHDLPQTAGQGDYR